MPLYGFRPCGWARFSSAQGLDHHAFGIENPEAVSGHHYTSRLEPDYAERGHMREAALTLDTSMRLSRRVQVSS